MSTVGFVFLVPPTWWFVDPLLSKSYGFLCGLYDKSISPNPAQNRSSDVLIWAGCGPKPLGALVSGPP